MPTTDPSAVFRWAPHSDSDVDTQSNIEVIQMGGDYEVAIQHGAHPHRRIINFVGKKMLPPAVLECEAFLRARGNKAFWMRDPDSDEMMQVRLASGPRRVRKGNRFRAIVFQAREVFEP